VKITIITVTYNSAQTLENTITSVLSQDYANIEYIVIDGGSSDATLEILEKYKSKIAKLISEKDYGLYDAINKGIALASGDVIGILHSDDFYIHHKVISNYVKVFEESNADAVYSNLYYVNRLDTSKITRKWLSGEYTASSFYFGWMPPHPTFFVKKEMYIKYGVFDLGFKTAADYELMLRFILKEKIRIAYLNEFTVKMRTGGASNESIGNRVNANSEDRRAWKKNGLKPKFYTLYLKPLRKLSQFF
jgi:glycosyltransferase